MKNRLPGQFPFHRLIVVSVLMVIAPGALLLWAQEAFGPLFCKQIPTDLSIDEISLISLPAVSPIRSAEELAEWIGPSVVYVERWFPTSATNPRWEPGTAVCTNQAAGTSTCATAVNPNPCFCATPGEGYVVKVSSPTTVQWLGKDASTVIPLTQVGAGFLISLPFSTPIATAKNLIDDIGIANVQSVLKFISATDGFQVYTGRKGSGSDFALQPGVAYVVRMNAAVNYVPSSAPPIIPPSCKTQDSDFGVVGGPTSANFAWELWDSAIVPAMLCADPIAPVTAAGDAVTLAQDFVTSINLKCATAPAPVLASKGALSPNFTVNYDPALVGPPTLIVGPMACTVTAAGCTFNPTVSTIVLLPRAPSHLQVTKSDTDALLYWDDFGDPTVTWNVYRATQPDTSSWGPPLAVGVVDAAPATTGIQWLDVDALLSTDSYYYKVTATNSAGETSLDRTGRRRGVVPPER